MKRILILLLALCVMTPCFSQHKPKRKAYKHPTTLKAQATPEAVATTQAKAAAKVNANATMWADSIMRTLTLEQQVAQLMVVRVPLNMNEKQASQFEKLLVDNQVGGVCFFVGTAKRQLELTRQFQKSARVPLLVCIDGEWGLGMRLKDCYSFPKQMLAGALLPEDDSLIYEMGREIGVQCRKMGIHVNFAPVVDLNSNPANPVIGARSFGENPQRVAHKGIMYMQGMQHEGVMAVAKHFPGHGDTDADSHYDLPVINHTKEYIDSIDTYPFRQLIDAGVRGVMVAHLQVNAYDSRKNRPTTLSETVVNELLRHKIGFKGLIITDGMDMKGVSKYYKDGNGELEALLAGNDIMLLPPDVEKSINAIVRAAREDKELKQLVEIHCRRVLREKYKCGLNHLELDSLQLPSREDSLRCDSLTYQMALKGVTMLNGENWRPGMEVEVVYNTPYKIKTNKRNVAQTKPIVVAYEDHPAVHRAVDSLLAGRMRFKGSLPVSAAGFAEGTGLPLPPEPTPYDRLAEVHMDESCFYKIDSIAELGIKNKAYPGCVVLVAKDGKVVYNRAYGHLYYDADSAATDTNTIFDLASLTKVTATTFAMMKLVDAGKVQLDDKLSRYLPYLKHSNKRNLTIRQVMSHCAGLKAFEPYWQTAQHSDDPRQSVLEGVTKSKLNKDNSYLYSDLGFILLSDLVQVVTGQSLDIFMEHQFYQPMGMTSTAFNPLDHGFDINRIAPTENDTIYRFRMLRGTVHDQNADVMGGVSGHAGLFSTSGDLAKLYLMMLNGGMCEGKQYLSANVINTFNHRYYADKGNRRALGYDKPLFNPREGGNTAPQVSQSSYGHTGFTGTMVWVDPQYKLVYIFLSNRVHPDANPNRLSQQNIRTDIQSLIYKSMK